MVAIIAGKGVGLERSSAFVLGSQGQLGSASLGRGGDDVYVNAATGNLVVTRQDEFLIGLGLDVSIDRTYNSQTVAGLTDGDNDDQWRMGVYRKVTGLSGTYGAANSTVKRIDWDGSDTIYKWYAADNAYIATIGHGAYDKLSKSGDIWTWTDGDTQAIELYDNAQGGRLTSAADADGNTVSYAYNGSGLITRVTSNNAAGTADDEYIDLVYDGTKLTQLNTHAGAQSTRIFYEYDTSNRLTKVKVNLNPGDISSTTGANYETTYTYVTGTKRIAEINQTDGSRLQIGWTLAGSVYKVSSLTQTVASGVTRVTNLTYSSSSVTVSEVGGPSTNVGWWYAYEDQLTQIYTDGAPGQTRVFFYNATLGSNYLDVTGFYGGPYDSIDREFDSHGNAIRERDYQGNTVTRTYSSTNKLLTETRYLVPDPDHYGSGQPSSPMTTRYAYDGEGHLRYIVSAGANADSGIPVGNVTEYRYNGFGERVTAIEYLVNGISLGNPVSGNIPSNQSFSEATMNSWVTGIADKSTTKRIDFTYDHRGNLLTETSYSRLNTDGTFDTNSELSQTIFVYDQAGNLLTRQSNFSAATETYVYDGLNRIISSTDFNGATTTIGFNDATQSSVVTLANGLIRTSTYNRTGELIRFEESGPGIAAAATEYRYDARGRLRMTIDAGGKRDYFLYDTVGRKIADIDTDGSLVEYRYDGRENVTSTTRYSTKVSAANLAALVDANGNPTSLSLAAIRPSEQAGDRWTWHLYDDSHRLVRTIDGTGATTLFSYDGASRLVSTRQYANLVSAAELAMLKASPGSINHHGEEAGWQQAYDTPDEWFFENCDWMEVAPIDGYAAYRFTANTWFNPAAIEFSCPAYGNGEGLKVTAAFTLKAAGWENHHEFGFYNPEEPDDWFGDATAVIVSGPGMIERSPEGQWQVFGLSNTQATRIELVRTIGPNEATQFRLFVKYRDPYSDPDDGVLNKSLIISNASMLVSNYFPPALPGETGTDRLTRNFYDKDDRLFGRLDAEGYLTKIVYDKAGQKIETIAYAGATSAGLRASGTFAQLLASITIDNAKDIHTYCVYDARGLLRAQIDGEGDLTRYAYTPLGDVSEMVTGQRLDPAGLLATRPTFANLPAAPSGIVLETTAYTRNLYGQILTETRSLTDSTSTVTVYTYDNMRRLVSTTTQSGDPDARTESRRYDLRGRLTTTLSGIGSEILAALGPNPDEEVANPIWTEYGTSFGYDAADRLVAISDAVGARTVFYYDVDDRLVYQVDAVGAVVEYRYNSLGDRTDAIVHAVRVDTETLVEMVGGSASSVAGIVTALANAALDQASHVEFNLDGTIKQVTDPLGALATYAYNAFGELVVQSDPFNAGTAIQTSFAYDRRGQVTTRIVDSAAGGKAIATSYGHDAFGREIILTDANSHVTATAYDRVGRVVSTTDALNNTTFFTYDSRGNLVAVKDALNRITRFVYDNAGRRIFAVDALGGVVETSYDGDGRVLSTRAYANAISLDGLGLEIAAGDVTIQLDPDSGDRIARSAYDKDGRLRFVVDGISALTEYRYNDVGNAIRTIRYGWTVSPASTYTIDELQAEVDAHEADPRRITRAVYDRAGRMTFAIDGAGNVTAFSYDSAGRMIKQVAFVVAYNLGDDPLDDVMQGWAAAEAHADDRVSRAVYDRKGRLAYSVDAEGFVTEYRYNKRDGVVKEIRYADPYAVSDGATMASLATQIGSLPASAIVTDIVYDSAGRLAETIDGLGHRTVLTLDQLGQILSTTIAYGTSDAATTTRSYDALGRLVAESRADGTAAEMTTTYGYNALGELVAITRAVGAPAEWTTMRRYDVLGRLTSELSGIGSAMVAALGPNPDQELVDPIWGEYGTFYSYDEAGRLISTSNAVGGRTLFYYDTADRLAYQVDAVGDVVEFRHNALGDRIETIRYAARIDNETLWELLGGDDSDVAGVIAALADASLDDKTVATYDAAGRMSLSSGQLGSYTAYAYNSFGEVQLRKVALGESGTPGVATEIETSFTYDRRGKLETRIVDSAAGGKQIVTSHGYDGFGRWTSVTDANGHDTMISYDRAGRVVTTAAFDNATYFVYDARGNVVAVEDALGHLTRYVYDRADRRIFAVDALGGVVETSYDGDDRVLATRAYANAISLAGFGLQIAAGDVTGRLAPVSADRISRNAYDKDGRLRFRVDGAAGLIEYRYDDVGNAVRTIRYGWTVSPASTYTIDDLQAQVDAHEADPRRITRAVYDLAGKMTFAIDATAKVTAFTYDSAGRVIKQIVFATAYPESDDPFDAVMQSWAITNADAGDRVSRAVYDREGRLAYSVDAGSFVIEYLYNRSGNVTEQIRYADPYSVADGATPAILAALLPSSIPQSAVTTEFLYDSAGRLEKTRDTMGTWTVLTLDQLGQIISTTVAHGTSDATTTTRSYDELGRLSTETRADGAPEEATTVYGYNELGELTYIAYAAGTVDECVTYRSYDQAGRLETETRAAGTDEEVTTVYGHNAFGDLESTTTAAGSADEQVTTRVYDALGRLESETSAAGTTDEATTSYLYNAFGNVAKVTDPLLNSAYFYYDGLDRLTMQVDPEGYVTKTVYDVGDEPMSVTRYANKVEGATAAAPPEVTPDPAEDATTIFERDKLDRLTGIVDAENFTESYGLNAFGDRISVTNRLLSTTYNLYDERGLLIQETLPISSTSATGEVLATSIVNKFEYDRRGNRTKMIEAFGLPEARTTSYFYDQNDRLIEQRGEALTITTDTLATTTVTPSQFYFYDLRGNLIESVNANGAHVWSFYDHLNRKTGQVDALGTLSTWDHDGNGNVDNSRIYETPVALPAHGARTAPGGGASDYRETLYTYDGNNRLTHTTVPQLITGEYGTTYARTTADVITENVYDAAGNLVRQIDGRGNSIFSFYDKLGRRIAQVDEEKYLTFYTLDGDGNALKEERFATQLSGTITTASSAADLRTSVVNGANATFNRVTDFLYDRNGRRTYETRLNVDGKVLDAGGGLDDAAVSYAQIHYEYNGLGQVTRKTEANGDFVDYGYDAMGRETSIQSAPYTDFESASVRNTIDTFYNGLNRVTRSIERSKSGTADRVTSSTYGIGGRLASTTDAESFIRNYGYDAEGQVVAESYSRLKADGTSVSEAIAYRYDLAGRLVFQSTAASNGASWTFGDATQLRYNAFGEVTGRGINVAGDDWQETFDYDAGGRMWRSTSGDGSARVYLYDANGKATLTIASAGSANLSDSSYTLENIAGTIGLTGETSINEAVTTIAVYDKRGQDIATHAPSRQLAAGSAATITTSRVYNAFGEVTQETDARDEITLYSYNTMGRLIQRELPATSHTEEDGLIVSNVRPTENYSYDLSGRLIGMEDANTNIITRRLLTGTGYGDSEATVLAEYHADDGVALRAVDEFGDVRRYTDEISRVTSYAYDKMGRLTEQVHPANSLTDSYRYDGLGQRIKHWNSHYGPTVIDRTDYDADGRVVKVTQAFGTAETVAIEYGYSWNGNLVTNGLGTFGGWVQTTIYLSRANDNDSSETKDYFGHVIGKSDLGGRTTSFTYDKAGRLTEQTSSASQNIAFTYFNTGKIATITDGYVDATYSPASVQSTFAYDEAGNRLFEGYVKTTFVYDYETGYTTPITQSLQAATVTYDEIGRMKTFEDTGATGSNPASIEWEYDLVGNLRRVHSEYTPLLVYNTQQYETEHWYTYDSMNRMVHVMGYLNGERGEGEIVNDISTVGSGYAFYNAAGERTAFTTNYFYLEGGFGLTKEEYVYTAQGYLQQVTQSSQELDIITLEPIGGWSNPVLIGSDTRDALGRLTAHSEYSSNGAVVHSMSAAYNALSLKISESTSTRQYNNATLTTNSTFDYRAENSPGSGVWTGDYQGGVITHIQTNSALNGAPQPVGHTTNSFVWWDDAKLSVVTNKPSPTLTYTSTYSYDENGKLASIIIQDGRPRNVNFVTDLYGQVMSRTEYTPNTPNQNNPKEIYYYFNGLRVGDIGNNGPSQVDYSTAISERGAPPQTGPFKHDMAIYHADFDQAYDPISPGSEPDAASGYTVREGETLQSIARAAWGDAAMWYLIAEANGLRGTESLAAGTTLIIPPKVTNLHNNSDTFRVYDPNKALGDNSPTQVAPPRAARRGGGCGMLGQILLIAIAVAITIILKVPVTSLLVGGPIGAGATAAAAAAGTFASIAGAAVTGAIASAVSQGIGVVTGIQEKFSWKGVALSALSAGVSQGVGGGQLINGAGKFVNDVARGALVNAATQGVAVATGLQKKFDWAGIAVAGIISGVSGAISRALPGHATETRLVAEPTLRLIQGTAATQPNMLLSGLAGDIAGAATRSILTGTSFGDNILAVLPGVIGSTIGNMIGTTIQGKGSQGLSEEKQVAIAAEKAAILAKEAAAATVTVTGHQATTPGSATPAPGAPAPGAPAPGTPAPGTPGPAAPAAPGATPAAPAAPGAAPAAAAAATPGIDPDGVPTAFKATFVRQLTDRGIAFRRNADSSIDVMLRSDGRPVFSSELVAQALAIVANSVTPTTATQNRVAYFQNRFQGSDYVRQDLAAIITSFAYLSTSTDGRRAVNEFKALDIPIITNHAGVTETVPGVPHTTDSHGVKHYTFSAVGSLINWDPQAALVTTNIVYTSNMPGHTAVMLAHQPDHSANSSYMQVQSPALGLLHEIGHMLRASTNPNAYIRDLNTRDAVYDNREDKRVITGLERRVAHQLGEPTRTNHGSLIQVGPGNIIAANDPAHPWDYPGGQHNPAPGPLNGPQPLIFGASGLMRVYDPTYHVNNPGSAAAHPAHPPVPPVHPPAPPPPPPPPPHTP
jgi:YD repeat-containing protein